MTSATIAYLTPDDFVVHNVTRYPSLFASTSPHETKFRVLDHFLNVIGNGISIEDLQLPVITDADRARAEQLCNVEYLYYGYESVKRSRAVNDCIVKMDHERLAHPEIKEWIKFTTVRSQLSPYPNFQTRYSTVYGSCDFDFKELGSEWAKAATWYYTECLKFFNNSSNDFTDFGQFPCKEQEDTARILNSFKTAFSSTDKYKTNDDISSAYGVRFEGDRTNDADVAAFVQRRWEWKREGILKFINSTLEHLNTLV